MLLIALQENKITGRQADVLLAAYLASELVHRTVKPAEEVYQVQRKNKSDNRKGDVHSCIHIVPGISFEIRLIFSEEIGLAGHEYMRKTPPPNYCSSYDL